MITQKELRLCKLEAGGHEVLDEDGNSLGFIHHKDLMAHVRQYHEGFDKLSSARLSESLSVDREVVSRARRMMQETGCSVAHATVAVLNSDKELREKYERSHRMGLEPYEATSGSRALAEFTGSDSGGSERTRDSSKRLRFIGIEKNS
ncbi:MAG TPA: hypothetical protein VGY31_06860 [Terriglobia bacterium]|nr:hypothetical protein [Terriglobia bacterium]